MDKQELRQTIRNRKRQFTQAELGELSLSAISQLNQHPKVEAAHTLLLYYSLPDEVNTHEWIDELVRQGKKVILPVVVDNEKMILREYTGRQDLAEGSFHILEPIGKVFPENRYHEIEVAIIPGMSFDNEGHRLGRGKGYYDRFLSKMGKESTIPNLASHSSLYKIGICFGFQKEKRIPSENHDIVMDEVVCTL